MLWIILASVLVFGLILLRIEVKARAHGRRLRDDFLSTVPLEIRDKVADIYDSNRRGAGGGLWRRKNR